MYWLHSHGHFICIIHCMKIKNIELESLKHCNIIKIIIFLSQKICLIQIYVMKKQ